MVFDQIKMFFGHNDHVGGSNSKLMTDGHDILYYGGWVDDIRSVKKGCVKFLGEMLNENQRYVMSSWVIWMLVTVECNNVTIFLGILGDL